MINYISVDTICISRDKNHLTHNLHFTSSRVINSSKTKVEIVQKDVLNRMPRTMPSSKSFTVVVSVFS